MEKMYFKREGGLNFNEDEKIALGLKRAQGIQTK